jgi:hypothetical protein
MIFVYAETFDEIEEISGPELDGACRSPWQCLKDYRQRLRLNRGLCVSLCNIRRTECRAEKLGTFGGP